MIPKFDPMPFSEWAILNADIEIPDCKNCCGEGEVTCSCCGNVSECPDCDGTGKKGLRSVYDTLLATDRAAYEKYYGLPTSVPIYYTIGGSVDEQSRSVSCTHCGSGAFWLQ